MSKTALVTGAMSGLGAATVARLTADGIRVITMDISQGADFVVDTSDSVAVHAAVKQLGAVDILVNSAGVIGPNKPLWDVTADEWTRTFAINVTGTFNLCHAVAPEMSERGWGRIVNIASIAGKDGNPNLSAYSASKAAVIGLTKSLGKELATSGVLVNAIAPALIATPMNDDMTPEVLERLTGLIPMKRLGRSDEVAELVAWLASDRMTFSTGAIFDISGGRANY